MPEPDGDIPLPDRAYVPGITQRHPEGSFDPLRETVHPGMESDELQQSRAFRAGLRYLETGFFWECHEVFEAVWMAAPDGSSEKEMVQALIQLANARLKIVMKRPRAALRLCAMVEAHLARLPVDRAILGVTIDSVQGQVDTVRSELGMK